MDVQMPVMDGLTATRTLRREEGFAGLPVIAFTAGVLPDERQKALDAGVNDFLAKPVDLEEMVALLLRWGGGFLPGRDSVPPQPVSRDRESFLPEQLPGLDVARGMETLRGGANFYREMIGELVRVHGDDASGIRLALEGGNLLQGARLAHALKGVAGNLAAFTVHDVAGELEDALKEGAPAPVERLLNRLAEALSELRASALLLSEEPPPTGAGGGEPLPEMAEMEPLFQELTLLLQKRQMAALKVMKQLEKRLSCTIVAPEVALLSVAVDRLEFDVAQVMAAQLAQRIDELIATVTPE
jgi:two-component system, sensor histidine kinase and response regulator